MEKRLRNINTNLVLVSSKFPPFSNLSIMYKYYFHTENIKLLKNNVS